MVQHFSIFVLISKRLPYPLISDDTGSPKQLAMEIMLIVWSPATLHSIGGETLRSV